MSVTDFTLKPCHHYKKLLMWLFFNIFFALPNSQPVNSIIYKNGLEIVQAYTRMDILLLEILALGMR